jgi:hypothetical protein
VLPPGVTRRPCTAANSALYSITCWLVGERRS